MLNTAINGDPV